MRERVLNCLDNSFVEFGLFALHLDAHLLATTERDVAHSPGKLAPDVPDGLHASLHDLFLQFGGNEVHALGDCLKAGVFHCVCDLQKLVARQHQLTDQRHQLVEYSDPDSNRLCCGVTMLGFQALLGRSDVLALGETWLLGVHRHGFDRPGTDCFLGRLYLGSLGSFRCRRLRWF